MNDFRLEAAINRARQERLEKDATLDVTRHLYEFWLEQLDMRSHRSILLATERKIDESAKNEWGPDTVCAFEQLSGCMWVENFDGRKQQLTREHGFNVVRNVG